MENSTIYGPSTLTEQTTTAVSQKQEGEQKPFSFELSDGTVVCFKRAKADCMFKARKIAGNDYSNVPYLVITMVATFNGEKITLEDIKELDLADFLLLEEKWNEFCTPKKRTSQTPAQ